MRRRRPLVLLLIAIASLVLASVGTAAAARAGAEPVARHTAADMRKARQLVLGAGDLGRGWVAARSSGLPGTTGAGGDAASALRCAGFQPDLSGLIETGTAAGASLSFDDGQSFYSVGSAATVMKTPEMTNVAWNRSIRPAIVACFRSAFVRGLQLGSTGASAPAPVVRFSDSKVFEPSARAQRKVGFRIDASIAFRESGATSAPMPVVIEVVFLAQGRHLALATIASLGTAPSVELEKTVSGRLAARLGRGVRPSA